MSEQHTPEKDDDGIAAIGMAHIAERLHRAEQQLVALRTMNAELVSIHEDFIKKLRDVEFRARKAKAVQS